MDTAKAVYEHKRTWAVLLALGTAAAVMSFFVHGDARGSIRFVSSIAIVASLVRVSHQATADRLRDAYRAGRADKKRFGPVLVKLPRREEETADR